MEASSKRFGDKTEIDIDEDIKKNVPLNTKKARDYVWRQFTDFLTEKNYKLEASTSFAEINTILKCWASNMKKQDGTDYKEGVVKHNWNITAKLVQELYSNKWKITINPFSDVVFKSAREARDAKRRELQICAEKRTKIAGAITQEEITNILLTFDEDTPEGLQKKFFYIASFELAWRGGEGAQCLTSYFKEELSNDGLPTSRIEYNSVFSKTAQGGAKPLCSSKWLIENKENRDLCPVRLYHKLMSKRGKNIKTNRIFLTPNPFWNKSGSSNWFKNSPVGINEMNKWVKRSAEQAGLDVKRRKISNHSIRSSTVSTLAKAGVGEHQLMKISGHSNVNSIKSYLQLDTEHHEHIVGQLRKNVTKTEITVASTSTASTSSVALPEKIENKSFSGGSLLHNCNHVSFSNCHFSLK